MPCTELAENKKDRRKTHTKNEILTKNQTMPAAAVLATVVTTAAAAAAAAVR